MADLGPIAAGWMERKRLAELARARHVQTGDLHWASMYVEMTGAPRAIPPWATMQVIIAKSGPGQ